MVLSTRSLDRLVGYRRFKVMGPPCPIPFSENDVLTGNAALSFEDDPVREICKSAQAMHRCGKPTSQLSSAFALFFKQFEVDNSLHFAFTLRRKEHFQAASVVFFLCVYVSLSPLIRSVR